MESQLYQRNNSSFLNTSSSTLLVVTILVTSLLILNRRKENPQELHHANKETTKRPTVDDLYYLQVCHEIRLSISPLPRQSNFRVVCILLLDDLHTWIPGTNDEPSVSITGAICAERAALLQYQIHQYRQKIHTVYIVSDCEGSAIPPGMLCREYMNGHPAIDPLTTRIVLQRARNPCSDDLSELWVLALYNLYPYPSIYNKLDAVQQVSLGTKFQRSVIIPKDRTPSLPEKCSISKLLSASQVAAETGDIRTDVHPICYGAAAYVELTEISPVTKSESEAVRRTTHLITACQQKALEYGATQDSVCQLIAAIKQYVHEKNCDENYRILVLVQTDQFGIPHPPFAQSRSLLVEHGFDYCTILVSTMESLQCEALNETVCDTSSLTLEFVEASDLAPYIPKFR